MAFSAYCDGSLPAAFSSGEGEQCQDTSELGEAALNDRGVRLRLRLRLRDLTKSVIGRLDDQRSTLRVEIVQLPKHLLQRHGEARGRTAPHVRALRHGLVAECT